MIAVAAPMWQLRPPGHSADRHRRPHLCSLHRRSTASGRSGRVGSWFVAGKRLEKAPFDLFYLVSSTHIAQRLLELRDDAFVFRLFGYSDVSGIFRLNLE